MLHIVDAWEEKEHSLNYDPGSRQYSTMWSPSWVSKTKSQRLFQPEQRAYQQEFTQGLGTSTITVEDVFSGKEQGLLDVVLVLDNSGSMKEERAALAPASKQLLGAVQNSQWKMHVVTTNGKDGIYLGPVLEKNQPQVEENFRSLVAGAGTRGDSTETGIYSATAGLLGLHTLSHRGSIQNVTHQMRSQWVRPGSSVAVIIVSDENNCSDGQGCMPRPEKLEEDAENPVRQFKCAIAPFGGGTPHSDVTHWGDPRCLTDAILRMGKVLGHTAKVYAITSPGPEVCPLAKDTGSTYIQLAQTTQGHWGKICETKMGVVDYSDTLNAISTSLAGLVRPQFMLRYIPDSGSTSAFVSRNGAPYIPSSRGKSGG